MEEAVLSSRRGDSDHRGEESGCSVAGAATCREEWNQPFLLPRLLRLL